MKRYMNQGGLRRLIAALLGIAGMSAGYLLYSMDWPSPEGFPVSNFGWNDGGRPILGVSFGAEGPVLAADTGELVFIHTADDTASRLPSPLGTWLALDHGEGLISIYGRFEHKELPDIPKTVEKGFPLGIAGRSGWSGRRGFYFALFDRKERRWVNPAMIISPLPDTRSPVIQLVFLRNADGRIIDPAQVRTLGQGRYTISVAAADTRLVPNESPLAPYRIVCIVNGTEIGTLTFETYSARDGMLMVYRNGLVPVKEVYGSTPGLEVGEIWFTRGQANLEIIAQDISGNAQSTLYRLQVE